MGSVLLIASQRRGTCSGNRTQTGSFLMRRRPAAMRDNPACARLPRHAAPTAALAAPLHRSAHPCQGCLTANRPVCPAPTLMPTCAASSLASPSAPPFAAPCSPAKKCAAPTVSTPCSGWMRWSGPPASALRGAAPTPPDRAHTPCPGVHRERQASGSVRGDVLVVIGSGQGAATTLDRQLGHAAIQQGLRRHTAG